MCIKNGLAKMHITVRRIFFKKYVIMYNHSRYIISVIFSRVFVLYPNTCACELNVKYYCHISDVIVEGVCNDIGMDKTEP